MLLILREGKVTTGPHAGVPMWFPPPVPTFSYIPAGFGIRGHPIYNPDGPGPSGCTDGEPTENSEAEKGQEKYEERDAIRKDFPKPIGDFLHAPKLDEQVKDHLRRKGKDPHFGSEKALYKLQEQVIDVAGPLTCLWADLLNREAKVAEEDIILLVQRALVLLTTRQRSQIAQIFTLTTPSWLLTQCSQ